MYILDQYQKTVNTQDQLTNEKFMAAQIWQTENVFSNDLIAIKNIDLDYVAISDSYAKEFNLNNGLKIEEDRLVFNMQNIFTPLIHAQEQDIINNLEFHDSLFIVKNTDKVNSYYAFRKRPLINPANQEVLGIMITGTKYKPGTLYAQYIKYFLKSNNTNIKKQITTLTTKQQQIIFCLCLGYQSRKEIALILSKARNEQVSIRRVKSELNALYEKSECSTASDLIQSFFDTGIELPVNLVKESNYII